MSTIPNQRKVKDMASAPTTWLSVLLKNAPAHTPPVSTVVAAITRTPFLTVLFSGRRGRAGLDWRGRLAGGGPSGRSAVIAARSAYVRDASTPPTRESNSSLVNRPCTNASLSVPMTCSRSACEARRRPRPAGRAALSSPSPDIISTSQVRCAKDIRSSLRPSSANGHIGCTVGVIQCLVRCLIYVRISLDKAGDAHGVANQMADLEKRAGAPRPRSRAGGLR